MLNDINSILLLLLNFMYKSAAVKIALAKKGLADIVHKLWAWIVLNKTVSTTVLKLLASFTARLPAEDGKTMFRKVRCLYNIERRVKISHFLESLLDFLFVSQLSLLRNFRI